MQQIAILFYIFYAPLKRLKYSLLFVAAAAAAVVTGKWNIINDPKSVCAVRTQPFIVRVSEG